MKVAVFDLEVSKEPSKVGWKNYGAMGFACCAVVSVTYDLAERDPALSRGYMRYSPTQLEERMFLDAKSTADFLDEHDLVVGFNNLVFDNNVLAARVGYDHDFLVYSFDILDSLVSESGIKYLTNLDALARYTINEKKTEGVSGAEVVAFWQQGKRDEVVEYCKQDAWMTYRLFQFGLEHGYMLVPPNKNEDLFGSMCLKIPVDWTSKLRPKQLYSETESPEVV